MDESATAEQSDPSATARGTWSAQPGELRAMRTAMRSWLAPLHLGTAIEDDLILATNEAASNAIDHAYPPARGDNGAENANRAENTVHVTLHAERGTVCIEITDHGTWREPPAEPNGRGLGIPIIHRLVASLLIDKNAQGTRVLLQHPIAASRSVGHSIK
jgi:anti-sigma regulatory factor (Ser/Thr protein kinase)